VTPAMAGQSPSASAASDFIVKAADAGLKAIEISMMVADKASNEDVKWFARRLVVDHSLFNHDLLEFSRSRNVTFAADPTGPMKRDPSVPIKADHPGAHPATAQLMALDGAAFDKAYVDQMFKDQEAAFELFKSQAEDGDDAEIREWAEQKLLTLKEHLRTIEGLQEKMRK
jgi:putative membrane protein